MDKEEKTLGRPKTWTDEAIAEYKIKIIDEITINGYSLRRVCRLDSFPSKQVVLEWLRNDKDFQTQYVYACNERAEMMFEDMIEICDSTENDIITDIEGNQITNHNVIQRDKLRVDTRKWLLAKMMPKKYGDKLDVTTDGDKINTPPIINVIAPKE